jgi:hypothetical protein
VKVFSVATGRLLHDWSANGPAGTIQGDARDDATDLPDIRSVLSWIDGDQAVTLATFRISNSSNVQEQQIWTVRRLNVTGPVSGNLLTDSTVVWSGAVYNPEFPAGLPPLIVANGNTDKLVEFNSQDDVTYHPMPGAKSIGAPALSHSMPFPTKTQIGGQILDAVWGSPSGDKLIVEVITGSGSHSGLSVGVIANGKFTPLRLPASLDSDVTGIVF